MPFSGNVTAVLGRNLGPSLGKKGTSSDVTVYNHKLGDSVLSFVEPSAYPDKIQPLVSSLCMADQVLLKVEELNSVFAETVVALDAASIPAGYIIYCNGVSPDALKGISSGSVISSYGSIEDQPMLIKEKLSELTPDSTGDAIVQIDHSFSVKGVGTVALGVVKKGILQRHDELTIYPQRTKAQVKSLQVHDMDVTEAVAGLRVGLAFKDIKPEDVSRGSLHSTNASIVTASALDVDCTLSRYTPRPLSEGDTFLASAHLNYVPARVAEGSVAPGRTGKIRLSLEKELPMLQARLILLDPGQRIPRVLGHAKT